MESHPQNSNPPEEQAELEGTQTSLYHCSGLTMLSFTSAISDSERDPFRRSPAACVSPPITLSSSVGFAGGAVASAFNEAVGWASNITPQCRLKRLATITYHT